MRYDDFHALDAKGRMPHFSRDGRLFHFVMAQQLDRAAIENLTARADDLRTRAATPEGRRHLNTLLSHKRAMLYFNQPSSRTFFSFMNACYILGMKVSEARDPAMTSEKKGESFEDTIRTFASYTDVIIMRNKNDESSDKAVCTLSEFDHCIPVINAGSGKTEHPTQALLDIYTLQREFRDRGGIDGKHILMAGDLKRGRTVRSLCYLLALYKNVEIHFAAVPEFQMRDDIRQFLVQRGVRFHDVDDLAAALPNVDAVYMTRVQDEHDKAGESARIDTTRFHFRTDYLKRMKPTAIILHPLPRREEIPPEVDADPRAAYWRQEENGMWARSALLLEILGEPGAKI